MRTLIGQVHPGLGQHCLLGVERGHHGVSRTQEDGEEAVTLATLFEHDAAVRFDCRRQQLVVPRFSADTSERDS